MEKMKNLVTRNYQKVVVATGLLVASASSMAEGDPAAAAFTAVQNKVTTYEGYAWPVAIGVTGALIGISLFKKFVKRSAS